MGGGGVGGKGEKKAEHGFFCSNNTLSLLLSMPR